MTLKADPAAPLAAQVFKTRIDPFVQRLSFIRIFSGTLKKDATRACPGHRKGIKIGPLLSVQADKTANIDEAGPGDIVAVAKNEELHTGMSLGEVELPPLKFPRPMVGLAVTPKSPRRRNQALRRAAQDHRRRSARSTAARRRRPKRWSSPA